jgi:hypothetical protein
LSTVRFPVTPIAAFGMLIEGFVGLRFVTWKVRATRLMKGPESPLLYRVSRRRFGMTGM